MPYAADKMPVEGPEIYPQVRFLPKGVGVTSLTPKGYDEAVGRILPAAHQLAAQGADAVMLIGTSLSFYKGKAFNDALAARITAESGLPASTMSTAIVAALRTVGASRISVCTAYGDVVNDCLRRFLDECGLEVLSLKGMGIERFGDAGRVGEAEIIDLAREAYAAAPSSEALLISCGGLRTLTITSPLEAATGVPVISSMPAGFWEGMRLLGRARQTSGFGRLFELEDAA